MQHFLAIIPRMTVAKRNINVQLAKTTRGEMSLTLRDIRVVNHVPLSAVSVKPFAFARIVDNVLREALADDKTDQRLGSVVDGLVRRAACRASDEIPPVRFYVFRRRSLQYRGRTKRRSLRLRTCACETPSTYRQARSSLGGPRYFSSRPRRRGIYPNEWRKDLKYELSEHLPGQRLIGQTTT